jgi:hypothetical protein
VDDFGNRLDLEDEEKPRQLLEKLKHLRNITISAPSMNGA